MLHKNSGNYSRLLNSYLSTRRFFTVLIVLILVSLACSLPFGKTTPPVTSGGEDDPQVIALRQLEAASTEATDLDFEDGFPTFVSGRFHVSGDDPGEMALNFLNTYQDLYLQNNPDLDLGIRRIGGVEGQDVVFYQMYKGIPVFAGELVVSLDGGDVYATVGKLLTSLDLDTTPKITADEAEEIVRTESNQSEAFVIGETTLMVFDQSLFGDAPPEPHLSWRVTLGAPASVLTHVDAHTGEILVSYPTMVDGFWLDFKDAHFTDSAACYFLSPDDQTIGTVYGLDPAYDSDPDAVDGFRFSRDVYDFYHDTPYIRRDSYDGGGGGIEIYIHANLPNPPNAGWVGWECKYIEFSTGMVTWDIMVHEFAHGVIQHTSQLVYANQSGALNEGYSDVMGALADADDWTIGEDSIAGILRDMSNPGRDRRSLYFEDSFDSGGVHFNSGILNKAAYLIADGGEHNGWDIRGLGRNRMGALFYSVMVSLPSNASFMAARNKTVERADVTLSRRDACQVQNAFAAVELGDGDRDCDGLDDLVDPDRDNDSVPDTIDNCPDILNNRQIDIDGDGIGDRCDPDIDGDGFPNEDDNCSYVPNSDQTDSDDNDIGDACQDSDNDETIDIRDNCVNIYNRDQADMDGDGTGDVCDDNIDGDIFLNEDDLCPLIRNDYEVDSDGDGVGDSCDNCPSVSNPRQGNTDDDADGDACDEDDDDDGVLDTEDNCPLVDNPDQWDLDGNGIGLACDEDENLVRWGMEFPAEIIGGPGAFSRFPIPVCLADCPNYFPGDYLVSLVLSNLSSNVRVWVSDDSGRSVASSPLVDVRNLNFHPVNGVLFFLNFVFSPDYPEGGREHYSMGISAGVEEQPPDEETPTPTVTPTTAPQDSTIVSDYLCRVGPGAPYGVVSTVKAGTVVEILGVGAQQGWIVIKNPLYNVACWIPTDRVDLDPQIDLGSMQVFPVPVHLLPTDTSPAPSPPAAPTKLVANTTTCNSSNYVVTVQWKDNANNETGYRVYRDGAVIDTLGAGATSYVDNPPYSGPHTYKVEAFNGAGSAQSNSDQDNGCVF